MLKKRVFWIIGIVMGIILATLGLFINSEAFKTVSGICIGIGSGLFGLSMAQLYMIRYEQKKPDFVKRNEIEYKDERSVMIRHKAKAMAGDILHWVIMGIAWVNLLVGGPLWMTLVCVTLFITYSFLGLYLMTKYDQEL